MNDRLKISDKWLYRFLKSILELNRNLDIDDDTLSEYNKDTHNIMTCLLYTLLLDLEKKNIYYQTYEAESQELSEVIYNDLDLHRSIFEGTWMEEKFWSSNLELTTHNLLYSIIGSALCLSYHTGIEHKEFWDKACSHYNKVYGFDLNKLGVDDYTKYAEYCDDYLSISSFAEFSTILRLCRLIFDLYAIYNRDSSSQILNLDMSKEYIIQQCIVAEFRRVRASRVHKKDSKYKSYSCNITDKSRTIRKQYDNSFLGQLQADGVVTLSKDSNLLYAVIIDVKTNLGLKRVYSDGETRDSTMRLVRENDENSAQLYRYLSEFRNTKSIEPFGCLVHVVFNSDYWGDVHKVINKDKKTGYTESVTYGGFVVSITDDTTEEDFRNQMSELYDFLGIEKYLI